jgi:ketosteroid isomerase-like protein
VNRGDLDAAVAFYEPDAVLVAQPGQLARGTEQIRAALGGFVALKAVVRSSAEQVVESGDIALYLGRWSLQGADPSGASVTMGGESSDILRRQPDGRWLIALGNPWGAQLLPR